MLAVMFGNKVFERLFGAKKEKSLDQFIVEKQRNYDRLRDRCNEAESDLGVDSDRQYDFAVEVEESMCALSRFIKKNAPIVTADDAWKVLEFVSESRDVVDDTDAFMKADQPYYSFFREAKENFLEAEKYLLQQVAVFFANHSEEDFEYLRPDFELSRSSRDFIMQEIRNIRMSLSQQSPQQKM